MLGINRCWPYTSRASEWSAPVKSGPFPSGCGVEPAMEYHLKIAVVDGLPNLPECAEKEFIARFKISCENLAIDCVVCRTSDDIEAALPDFVLATHEFTRKLTRFPTLGAIWSPLEFFIDDPYRLKSIQSYDGYLPSNERLRDFLEDQQFGFGIRKPISSELFFPTTYRTPHFALETTSTPSIAYLGVRWDSDRHAALFRTLATRRLATFYGPAEGWRGVGPAFGGTPPFDGRSVTDVLSKHGLALCLHRDEHRRENTPSMRIFEALSVGAIPICDEIPFAREHLADVAFFIDTTKGAAETADEIQSIADWIRENPAKARARARRGKALFETTWSLEVLIERALIPTARNVATAGHLDAASPAASAPSTCDVIMPIVAEAAAMGASIESVVAASSADLPLHLILVGSDPGSEAVNRTIEFLDGRLPVRHIAGPELPSDAAPRSTLLWLGLRAAISPFVSFLTPGSIAFPNHYRTLHHALTAAESHSLSHSGQLDRTVGPDVFVESPNFDGPLQQRIPERRDLIHSEILRPTDLLTSPDNLPPDCWMARREHLEAVIGEDPRLRAGEHGYLALLLALRGRFIFTGTSTVMTVADEPALSIEIRDAAWGRIRRRAANLAIPSTLPVSGRAAALRSARARALPTRPPSAPPSEFKLDGGLAIAEHLRCVGFLSPDAAGLRTAGSRGLLLLPTLDHPNGSQITLTLFFGPNGGGTRTLHIGIVDGPTETMTLSVGETRECAFSVPAINGCVPAATMFLNDAGLGIQSAGNAGLGDIQLTSVHITQVFDSETVKAATVENADAIFSATYFEDGRYSQVDIHHQPVAGKSSSFKIQSNDSKFSIEIELSGSTDENSIDKSYIETGENQYFRIYFNDDGADMSRRASMLPLRLKRALLALASLDPNLLMIDHEIDHDKIWLVINGFRNLLRNHLSVFDEE